MTAPEVFLTDEDDASGMASMLAGLLGDNIRDFPSRARVARMIRGDVVFTAADRELSVTLSFFGDRVEVSDGAAVGAPSIRAPWLTMAKLCSGQVSPVRALRDHDLELSLGRRPASAGAASFVVSVPPSYYGETNQRKKFLIAGAVAVAAVVLISVARRSG